MIDKNERNKGKRNDKMKQLLFWILDVLRWFDFPLIAEINTFETEYTHIASRKHEN